MTSTIKVDTIAENTSANGVSIDGLTIKDGGISATTGAIVFNEASADLDFRVESNDKTHMLFVDGGNDKVGIGTSAPVVPLSVRAAQEQLTLSEGDARGATFDYRSSTGNLNITTNGGNARTAPQFTLDLNGKVGIGTSAPTQHTEIVLNSTGAIPTDSEIGSSNAGVAMGLGIHNESNSATYTGIAIETRTSGASRWLIANEWQSTYNGDLVFRNRNGGSSSTEVMRLTSGGLAIGGTGAANTLDDYEEGVTGNVTLTCGSSGSASLQSNFRKLAYTKVGRLVTITGLLKVTSVSSPTGGLTFALPFALASLGDTAEICRGHGYIVNAANAENGDGGLLVDIQTAGGTSALIAKTDNTANGLRDLDSTFLTSQAEISLSFSYFTT